MKTLNTQFGDGSAGLKINRVKATSNFLIMRCTMTAIIMFIRKTCVALKHRQLEVLIEGAYERLRVVANSVCSFLI